MALVGGPLKENNYVYSPHALFNAFMNIGGRGHQTSLCRGPGERIMIVIIACTKISTLHIQGVFYCRLRESEPQYYQNKGIIFQIYRNFVIYSSLMINLILFHISLWSKSISDKNQWIDVQSILNYIS